MRRLWKAACIIAALTLCAGSLTGCGGMIAKHRIAKEARYYTANKYHFRPGTTGVEFQKVGELEGIWHKKDAGTASMEYQGRTFEVYVSLVDPEIRYDNYLRQDAEEYLAGYFDERLDCDAVHVWATYGTPVCMVPGDVKTVEDIFATCDNIQIYVSTFGLDGSSAKSQDFSALGSDTEISVIDWTSEDCLQDEELMRETAVGLETDTYTDGFGKVRSYYHYEKGKVTVFEQ